MKNRIKKPLIALLVFVGLHQAAAQVSFATTTNYAVGKGPYSVVAADIYGNGKVDLICVNEQVSSLTVLTNNGSGIFSSNASYTVGGGPGFVTATDVNSDGMVDLISANQSAGTLTVLTNNGSGKFGRASTPSVGSLPRSVVTADVNGGGMVDLFVSCGNNANPLILLTNAGDGMFITSSALPPPPVSGSSWHTIGADVNGDGKPDLIDLDSGNGGTFSYLRILTNSGNGAFVLSSTNARQHPGLAFPQQRT